MGERAADMRLLRAAITKALDDFESAPPVSENEVTNVTEPVPESGKKVVPGKKVRQRPPGRTPVADVEIPRVCETCGETVESEQADLSRIRFRKILCREHFLVEKKH